MSWLYSQALVEAFSEENSWDGEPCAPLNVMPTPHKFWRSDKMMEPSNLSRFGLTCAVLTEDHGAALLTWYLADSLARTSAQQVEEQASRGSVPASGLSSLGSLARWDRDSSLWRTPQCSLLADLDEFSGTWPNWGSMRNGECWGRMMPALPTFGSESGFWPTPGAAKANNDVNLTCSGDGRAKPNKLGWAVAESLWPTPRASDGEKCSGMSIRRKEAGRSPDTLPLAVKMWPTPTAVTDTGGAALCKWGGSGARAKLRTMVTPEELNGSLNPQWVAWLMGWPTEWTSLEPLATDKFRAWLLWHSPRSCAA